MGNNSQRATPRKPKRKTNPQVKPLHKRKTKVAHMNAGGFYDGMPGVVIDQYGNRKMIEFTVTPQGISTSIVHAHPKLCKATIQEAMSNPMVRGVVHSAVLDQVFASKTPWNFLLRLRLRLSLHLHHKRQEKKMKAAQEKFKKSIEDEERKAKAQEQTLTKAES